MILFKIRSGGPSATFCCISRESASNLSSLDIFMKSSIGMLVIKGDDGDITPSGKFFAKPLI
jgi:hypothetical protein